VTADPPSTAEPETPWPPEAFTPRAEIARAKGLEAPYIAGGDDPNLEAELAKEQPYVRLLIAMIAVIVVGGFVIGIIGLALSGSAPK
jgi:hypothetical protein